MVVILTGPPVASFHACKSLGVLVSYNLDLYLTGLSQLTAIMACDSGRPMV